MSDAFDAIREFWSHTDPQLARLSVGGESAPYLCRGCKLIELPAAVAMDMRSQGDRSLSVFRTCHPPTLRLVPHDPGSDTTDGG